MVKQKNSALLTLQRVGTERFTELINNIGDAERERSEYWRSVVFQEVMESDDEITSVGEPK